MPCSAAARPRLPSRATLSSRSKHIRSDTRGGNGIATDYDFTAAGGRRRTVITGGYDGIADRSLPRPAISGAKVEARRRRRGGGASPSVASGWPLGLILVHPLAGFSRHRWGGGSGLSARGRP